MNIAAYLAEIRALYKSGQTTEHSFRPALARLFEAIDPTLTVINEPKRTVDVGAPDFVFARNGISIGWCEAKDIGKDVRKFAAGDYSKEQKGRYTKGLPNLIYTNGLDFEFIRQGESVAFVTIADLIPTLPDRAENFPQLERLLADFASQTPVSITSAKQLAKMMAAKAALIKDIMGNALVADIAASAKTDLDGQYQAFKQYLIHDISVAEFADIYAETLAYGLFAARLHDTTQDTFSRTEALELLPKSNPFLRSLFVYIAGPNLDDRLVRMIDDLCAIFLATDLHDLLKDFGKFTARNDPFLHFYETFLAEYNPAKRKARGVWYTPEPVVNFIVRAVDDVLKSEFGLADGLADTSKVSVDWDTGQTDLKTGKPVTIKKDVHRVQVLDPATGTGTFLAEVIKLVAGRVKGIAPGQWSSYVENELIPRLHGFELLMASYAMCHMKLDMMLTELGYKPSAAPPRLSVYLTNSLEEGERIDQTLFGLARDITNEAKAASEIKRDQPIMCVIGNPPYSGESANKGKWIMGLMEAYKQEPGGKQKLQERNPKWINDDYVKFIRFAEHMIAKNGEGVLGFITNHGYLDNPTFRGMRWHLLDTFDKIYVLDLHGNAKKKEVSPDGSPDKNVFDIMQGVAIIIGVKRKTDNKQAKALAEVWHGELWGSRDQKYGNLWEGSVRDSKFSKNSIDSKIYEFPPKDFVLKPIYENGFSVRDFFSFHSIGIVTSKDSIVIAEQNGTLESQIKNQYGIFDQKFVQNISYRPFDNRKIYFDISKIERARLPIMRHLLRKNNIALLSKRQGKRVYSYSFLADRMAESCMFESAYANNSVMPLYLYPEAGTLDQTVRVNFDPKLYAQIRAAAGLTAKPLPFRGGEEPRSGGGVGAVAQAPLQSDSPHPNPSPEGEGLAAFRTATGEARPDEVKVFDYIYGVLHAPNYRETYREFLKIDFPRVPFPRDPATFRAVSEHGEALRRLHLMEDAAIGETPFAFEGEGDSVVEKPRFELPPRTGEGDHPQDGGGAPSQSRKPSASGKLACAPPPPSGGPPSRAGEDLGCVWINANQYFAGVSETAWNFHIGGYQPAQKWLKDRKGRALSWDDIRHYQKIIKILSETDRIMRQIALPLG